MDDLLIPIVAIAVVVAGVSACVVAWFGLQRHRADAAAMDSYRRLAEEVAARSTSVDHRLEEVSNRLGEVERLLRSVG